MQALSVKHFFDPATSTLTYVVCDPKTLDAVIIDPVLDYQDGRHSEESFTRVADYIAQLKLKIHFILETHAHADHLSAAQAAKKRYSQSLLGIGERIREVQATFAKDFDLADIDGSQFDRLFVAGEEVEAGSLKFKVMPLPGHTPACVGYYFPPPDDDVANATANGATTTPGLLFSGDAIFMPDYGTGRCDFPGGSAEALFASISEGIYRLPENTQIFVGHDYQPGGRELRFQTTVAEERAHNIHLKANTTKEEFVRFRTERDKTLKEPRLMNPSLRYNLVAGKSSR